VAEGILREHLAEIVELLEHKGIRGVSLVRDGKELYFTGAFRDSMLDRLGIMPELPPGEPPAVQYLGGFRFKIGDREVEFVERAFGKTREFYTELKFPSRDEAERFARSLKAVGVYAEVVGNTARLDSNSFFGLLAVTNAVPSGLTLLYRSGEDDFRVYARVERHRPEDLAYAKAEEGQHAGVEEGRMCFYFAVKHGGVWKVAEGLYRERRVQLRSKEREVLEAVRGAVAKALKELGRSADIEEPKEIGDRKENVEIHYLQLHGPHLVPLLRHAAEGVEAKPAKVRLEGRNIIIEVGEVKAEVEFKPLKFGKVEHLTDDDVAQTLALYKSLKEMGVRVEITPGGVKMGGEAMWALVATVIERGAPDRLPTEVMPSVELLKMYSAGDMKLYIFRVSEEGIHYYFAVKTKQRWRAAGGKLSGRRVIIYGEAARAVADGINALYRERGVDRWIEVRYSKHYNEPYIQLTNVDLRLLGLRQHER